MVAKIDIKAGYAKYFCMFILFIPVLSDCAAGSFRAYLYRYSVFRFT